MRHLYSHLKAVSSLESEDPVGLQPETEQPPAFTRQIAVDLHLCEHEHESLL